MATACTAASSTRSGDRAPAKTLRVAALWMSPTCDIAGLSCRQREGAGPGYLELRKMAADYMQENPEDFRPFADLSPYEVSVNSPAFRGL